MQYIEEEKTLIFDDIKDWKISVNLDKQSAVIGDIDSVFFMSTNQANDVTFGAGFVEGGRKGNFMILQSDTFDSLPVKFDNTIYFLIQNNSNKI